MSMINKSPSTAAQEFVTPGEKKGLVCSWKRRMSRLSQKTFFLCYLAVTQFSRVNHKQMTFCWSQCFMLPYYLVPFLQRKLFEQQQVEERKERGDKKNCWQISRIWERYYYTCRSKGEGEFILKKKCDKMTLGRQFLQLCPPRAFKPNCCDFHRFSYLN